MPVDVKPTVCEVATGVGRRPLAHRMQSVLAVGLWLNPHVRHEWWQLHPTMYRKLAEKHIEGRGGRAGAGGGGAVASSAAKSMPSSVAAACACVLKVAA